jgi:hypothetical protein
VTATSTERLHTLMTQSLAAWRLAGSIRRARDGAIQISCNAQEIIIERAAPELPFRWMVTAGGRRRGAISLVAVLRQVREKLDPGYAAMRVRVANLPLVPP